MFDFFQFTSFLPWLFIGSHWFVSCSCILMCLLYACVCRNFKTGLKSCPIFYWALQKWWHGKPLHDTGSLKLIRLLVSTHWVIWLCLRVLWYTSEWRLLKLYGYFFSFLLCNESIRADWAVSKNRRQTKMCLSVKSFVLSVDFKSATVSRLTFWHRPSQIFW